MDLIVILDVVKIPAPAGNQNMDIHSVTLLTELSWLI
jgi:hypothetical protein